jgi:hypothetical protein
MKRKRIRKEGGTGNGVREGIGTGVKGKEEERGGPKEEKTTKVRI